MTYLVAKKLKGIGSVAIAFDHLAVPHAVRTALNRAYADTDLQIIALRHPHMYGEYAPYTYINSEGAFMQAVSNLAKAPDLLTLEEV